MSFYNSYYVFVVVLPQIGRHCSALVHTVLGSRSREILPSTFDKSFICDNEKYQV